MSPEVSIELADFVLGDRGSEVFADAVLSESAYGERHGFADRGPEFAGEAFEFLLADESGRISKRFGHDCNVSPIVDCVKIRLLSHSCETEDGSAGRGTRRRSPTSRAAGAGMVP